MPALAPSSAHGVLEANNDDDGKPKHRAPAACMVVQRKKRWAHARNRNLPLVLPHSWSGLAGLAMLTWSRHLLEPGKGAQCRAPDGISGGLKGWDWCLPALQCHRSGIERKDAQNAKCCDNY